MIEHVVRTAAAAAKGHVRFKEVRSRAKVVRAEPILSPYEQGRVHHLGFFPALAHQLTARTAMRATAPLTGLMLWDGA